MLLVIIILVFSMMPLMPGSIVDYIIPPESQTSDNVALVNAKYGLDRPVWEQFFIYMNNLLHGDLGTSWKSGRPVIHEIKERFANTLKLGLLSLILSIIIGIPMGILASAKQFTIADYSSMTFALLGISIPNFWLGIMMILIFSVRLGWFPPFGSYTAHSIVLPALTLGFSRAGGQARLTKSCMLDVLREDYIRTARSKGLKESLVLYKHAFKNASMPLLTSFGMSFGRLISGSFVTETVFAWPGLGRLMLQAIRSRDIVMIQGAILIFTFALIIGNLIADILYGVIDPRIRYQ